MMFRYMALSVAKEFLTGGALQDFDGELYNGFREMDFSTVQYLQDHIGELVKLTNEQCNETYSTTLLNDWRNVLLVTDVSQTHYTLLEGWEFMSTPEGAAVSFAWDGRLSEAFKVNNRMRVSGMVSGSVLRIT